MVELARVSVSPRDDLDFRPAESLATSATPTLGFRNMRSSCAHVVEEESRPRPRLRSEDVAALRQQCRSGIRQNFGLFTRRIRFRRPPKVWRLPLRSCIDNLLSLDFRKGLLPWGLLSYKKDRWRKLLACHANTDPAACGLIIPSQAGSLRHLPFLKGVGRI